MNRKNLTAAVLAGLAGVAGIVGSAQAVNINPDGLGQVLIYPYYTTNGDNFTVLSVVNTSESAKAVKVRFKEGKNSREVLDFNLYLSAYDVWTAAIYDDAGTPTLATSDTSCTVPYIYDWDHDDTTGDWTDGSGTVHVDGVQPFLPWGMNDIPETGDTVNYRPISDANEGYFEMIEMGTVASETDSETSITHVAGVPHDCAAITAMWYDPNVSEDCIPADGQPYSCDAEWVVDPDNDMDDSGPTGGLFGGAAIVNVSGGTMYSYDAKAIDAWQGRGNFGNSDFIHIRPGHSHPSLDDGSNREGIAFINGVARSSGTLDRPVDAVSYVFMHDALMNEYTTESLGDGKRAATEWVVNFPTKSFYTYGVDAPGQDLPRAPFTAEWDEVTETACESVLLDRIWDREETSFNEPPPPPPPGGGPIVSPEPPGPPPIIVDPIIPFTLCYEVSVIEFGPGSGDTTGILGSYNFHNIDNLNDDLGYENGWARLDLFNYISNVAVDGTVTFDERVDLGGLNGLPVTGFAVQSFENGFIDGGTLANYGGIFQHKYTRKLGSSSPK